MHYFVYDIDTMGLFCPKKLTLFVTVMGKISDLSVADWHNQTHKELW